jgi:hypothetical protein
MEVVVVVKIPVLVHGRRVLLFCVRPERILREPLPGIEAVEEPSAVRAPEAISRLLAARKVWEITAVDLVINDTVLITGPVEACAALIEIQVSAPVAVLDVLKPVKILSASDVGTLTFKVSVLDPTNLNISAWLVVVSSRALWESRLILAIVGGLNWAAY